MSDIPIPMPPIRAKPSNVVDLALYKHRVQSASERGRVQPHSAFPILGDVASGWPPEWSAKANREPRAQRQPATKVIRAPEMLEPPAHRVHLCHYERQHDEVGLAVAPVGMTCRAIQQSGFDGCPAAGHCIAPSGQHVERPPEMQAWASVTNFARLSQQAVAQVALDALYREGYACVGKLFYAYEGGIYRLVDDEEFMQRLLQLFGPHMRMSDAQQIVRYTKLWARQASDFFAPNRRLVCFNNGTLNVETGELGPYSPDHRLVSRICAAYVRTSECRRFLRFLEEVFRDDPDRDERIRFLRQWMGYLLIADTSFQKMLFLLGKGANGKSVLCKVIEAMLGKENVSHAMLNRLGRAAVRVELADKLANISPDLPSQALKEDGYIKAFVSGDAIEAERKYSDSCTIRPFCRFVVATNSMPDTSDRSDGFFRRVIVLTFNRQFNPEEQDPGLLDELLGELDGIIAWAVEGLRELLAAGEFTIPPSSTQALSDYRHEANPVQQFAEECLVGAPNGNGIPASQVFCVYSRWCTAHGQAHGTSIGFGRALANLGFRSRKSSHTIWLVSLSPGAGPYQPS